MGMMPPYDPFLDSALHWAVVTVLSCEPRHPTWQHPAVVTLAVESVLCGTLPREVVVLFDAPREAAQERFYAVRDASPEVAQRQLTELDRRPIAVPEVGACVIVWLSPPEPPPALPPGIELAPPGGPGGPPGGLPSLPAAPPGGFWSIPSLRTFEPSGLPMHQRWIEHSSAVEATVRERLGG